ncbi:MAG: DUF924 family protein [Gammaproteobacteria bacterium]
MEITPLAAEGSAEILEFWFGTLDMEVTPPSRVQLWFGKSDETDQAITRQYAGKLARARRGELDEWADMPQGRLALIIVLDQFSRHIHRGLPAAYASDSKALALAVEGVQQEMDKALCPVKRVFFYIPMMHAESAQWQDESVKLYRQLRDAAPRSALPFFDEVLRQAEHHRQVVVCFGRYPHRNKVLGRHSTLAERDFLSQPGSTF